MRQQRKIMAIASIGGHWIQLLRITKALDDTFDIVYISTQQHLAGMVPGKTYHTIPDFSRWDAWRMGPAFFRMLRLIIREKPQAIITTGAAPGLIGLLAGWLTRRKTIWVDSLANVEHLSACGRIASWFATEIYTQWEDLASRRVRFAGNTIG